MSNAKGWQLSAWPGNTVYCEHRSGRTRLESCFKSLPTWELCGKGTWRSGIARYPREGCYSKGVVR